MFKTAVSLYCAASLLGASAPPAPAPQAGAVPAVASRCGLVWLEIDPGPAEVSLDGEFLDAGVWLLSVPPGPHEIRVRKASYRPYAARIQVEPGASLRLDIRLRPDSSPTVP